MVAEKGIAGMSRDAFATVARRLCDIRATRCDRFATFARCLCDVRAIPLRLSRDEFASFARNTVQ